MKNEALAQELHATHRFFNNTISCFEESDGGFRATPESLTVAEHIAHTAQTIDWFIKGGFSDQGFDLDFEKHWKDVRGMTSLAQAKTWLEKSFAAAIETFKAKSDAALAAPIADGPIMGGQPRGSIVGAIVDHSAHHRGALAVYARLLGKTPQMPYGA